MKFLKLLIMSFLLASASVNAEVLVYKWKAAGSENTSLDGGLTFARNPTIYKGYLVVNYVPATDTYTQATLVKYWTFPGGKAYTVTEDFLGGVATFEKKVFSGAERVLISGFLGKNKAEMESGRAVTISAAQAGGGNALTIARSLTGNSAWNETYVQTMIFSGKARTSLQLDARRTRNANNSGLTVLQTVADIENEILVKYVKQPPTALDDYVQTDMNTPITIKVLDNDYEPNPGAVVSVNSITVGPAVGAAVINADNTITYTPNADRIGTDVFVYLMQDDLGGTSTANAVITVNYPYETELVSGDIRLGDYPSLYGNCENACINRTGQYVYFKVYDPATYDPPYVPPMPYSLRLYDRYARALIGLPPSPSTDILDPNRSIKISLVDMDISVNGKSINDAGDWMSLNTTDQTNDVPSNGFSQILSRNTDDLSLDYVISVILTATSWDWGNGNSYSSVISSDENQYVYSSEANNLIAGDTNGKYDIYALDVTQTTAVYYATNRMSLSTTGIQSNGDSENPAVSASGRFVVFESDATNLIDARVLSGCKHIFLRDRDVSNSGTFDTAGNVRTVLLSQNNVGTEGDGDSSYSSIAGSGNTYYIVYTSSATNLVANDTNNLPDIFLCTYNATTTLFTTSRISVSSAGAEANGPSNHAQVTEDGLYVVFESGASNLADGDLNGASDIFIRDTVANSTAFVTINADGEKLKGESYYPSIGTDGNYLFISYSSNAPNVTPDDTDTYFDIFVQVRKDIYK